MLRPKTHTSIAIVTHTNSLLCEFISNIIPFIPFIARVFWEHDPPSSILICLNHTIVFFAVRPSGFHLKKLESINLLMISQQWLQSHARTSTWTCSQVFADNENAYMEKVWLLSPLDGISLELVAHNFSMTGFTTPTKKMRSYVTRFFRSRCCV